MMHELLAQEAARIERYLLEYFDGRVHDPSAAVSLEAAMRYSLEAGGKRLRPVLVQTVYKTVTGVVDPVLPLAAALEMIHTYSLIHDDLPAMDDDDLRRGLPTCHIKFGEATAILAGDALLTEAFRAASMLPVDPVLTVAVIRGLAEAAGMDGMVAGQAADLEAEKNPPGSEGLEYIHLHKTAALLRASVRLPAIAAGCTDADISAFDEYGKWLGLAFQAADDLLDVAGDVQLLGKPTGSDVACGKTTFVSLYGQEETARLCRGYADAACAALDALPFETGFLKQLAVYSVERKS